MHFSVKTLSSLLQYRKRGHEWERVKRGPVDKFPTIASPPKIDICNAFPLKSSCFKGFLPALAAYTAETAKDDKIRFLSIGNQLTDNEKITGEMILVV
jgi:hypothetical protein